MERENAVQTTTASDAAKSIEQEGIASILIVDDLPEKLMAFQAILEDLGQNLVRVRSGSEALAEILRREFAVILLDVNMPDIDGLETASLIRQYKRSAHTPIIFITAYADEMQTAKGYSLGAVDYILSPVRPDILRSKVKVFVELYQLQQRTRRMAEERIALAQAETARQAAEEANSRKDEFIAMLSHELRNPLAPIRAAVEVIRRVAPHEPNLMLASEMMDRQVTHLVRLVDEMLDVSRINHGRIALRREQVELSKIVAHGVETARPLIDARNQVLTITLPPAPVWVLGDVVRLTQVVANLLNNATKYTQEGGTIEITATAAAGEATIIVRDNGAGIEPTLLPQVFDLFVQGKRSLDRSQGGLGIGLTLVRHLVDLHHGSVEAQSDGLGKGATFRVVLPCISAVNEGAAPAVTTTDARNQGRRVLVVDDNADAADSIAMFLRLEGHEVKVVGDGAQALASAAVFAPQVIVLDIGLPELSGHDVARRLRQQPEQADTLLIALTGYGQREERVKAMEAGFDFHFIKPVNPSEIQRVISGNRKSIEAPRSGEAGVTRSAG